MPSRYLASAGTPVKYYYMISALCVGHRLSAATGGQAQSSKGHSRSMVQEGTAGTGKG